MSVKNFACVGDTADSGVELRQGGIWTPTGDGRSGSGYGGPSTADRTSEIAVETFFRGRPTHALPIRELELDNRGGLRAVSAA